jgi:hypothetical protein
LVTLTELETYHRYPWAAEGQLIRLVAVASPDVRCAQRLGTCPGITRAKEILTVLKIVRDRDRHKPLVFCGHCWEQIADARQGNYL